MSAISIKAVVIGAAIDVGGTLVAGVVFTVIYMAILAGQGVAQDDLQHRIMTDESFYAVSLILGIAFLAGGSFVAARIARAREVLHAGLVGVVAIATGALIGFGDTSMYPSWYIPVSFGITLPIALLSGYVAQRVARLPKP